MRPGPLLSSLSDFRALWLNGSILDPQPLVSHFALAALKLVAGNLDALRFSGPESLNISAHVTELLSVAAFPTSHASLRSLYFHWGLWHSKLCGLTSLFFFLNNLNLCLLIYCTGKNKF